MEKMYTINELTEVLNVNPMTLQRHCKAQRIRAYKVSKKWLIPESEVKYILHHGYHVPGQLDDTGEPAKRFTLNGKTYVKTADGYRME